MLTPCPHCQQPLTYSEQRFDCPHCQRHFTALACCPDCQQPLQVLKACGAIDYFCTHGHGLISSRRVHYRPEDVME
ncbi:MULTISPECIES: zinc ribbon domain-containing protein [Pantoea]|uniref:Primosomal protein N' (Replication factor Y)-superfamily II helicase n=1 Tax=Pantoea dispersa TaxID=59814 RepID=A0A8E1S169_9GAMM|nr:MULTISPECIES: zinc ribbon domain-containing protein [Pantoea]MBK4768432.1 hypothetical protein [Pantoea sp. Morm]KTR91288.1 hypothetical protein SA2_07855 [Pantoea dispersa]KTR99358.1 hypothetical protein NS375_10155 [Pantoea dispersa]KTS20113.1 hypothetical protein SA4R_19890 [Pantoea dispersa]KTS60254.1 hypothetical protein SA5R_12210 [Pantoea dispersa]